MVTIAADLLRTEEVPSYSYLLDMWLVEHTGLTIFLTALFALLALFCFCFSLAAAGHWQGHEGIHLTWLDKIPADVWLIVLLCTFSLAGKRSITGGDSFSSARRWCRLYCCSCASLPPSARRAPSCAPR